MAFGKAGKNGGALRALSEMEEMDYSRESSELQSMYDRLKSGKKDFANLMQKNLNAVMKVSALDVGIADSSGKMSKVTSDVSQASGIIHQATTEMASIAGEVTNAHENLTNTIIEASKQDIIKKKHAPKGKGE